MKILIFYGSTHGHTATIADRMAARMRERGAQVLVTGCPEDVRAADFDAVVVGGRVHGSRIQRSNTETLPGQRLPKLGWVPDRTEVIGGALFWKAQYGILAPLFKRMWRRTLGSSLDPTRSEQVFTDWPKVDRFAESFLRLATSRCENHGTVALRTNGGSPRAVPRPESKVPCTPSR
jgi:menaquinone-dependent protoporphyrinogen oxidase